jgi:hypothetical protein
MVIIMHFAIHEMREVSYCASVLSYRQFHFLVKGKGKAIPLEALTGPKGSRSLRLPHFKKIGT